MLDERRHELDVNWPFEFPGVNWVDEQKEQAVLDVARKGSFFRYYGPSEPSNVQTLEGYEKDFYGVKHALAVNSGTGALITAIGMKLSKLLGLAKR